MTYLTEITSKIARSEGDPKVVSTGPSSLGAADRLGRALGWFSFGLGIAELLAARRITRALGMGGKEALVRAYGAREIGAGVLCLSIDQQAGLWSRVAGDGVDIAFTLEQNDHPEFGGLELRLEDIQRLGEWGKLDVGPRCAPG